MKHAIVGVCSDEGEPVNEATPLRSSAGAPRRRLFWVSHMDGMQRVFIVTQTKPEAKQIAQVRMPATSSAT